MIRKFDIGDYHMRFDTATGAMARWGKTEDDDPVMCPIGPEVIDIEISTVCNGIGKDMSSRKPCAFCYKSNSGCGSNMSLDTFKTILDSIMCAGFDIELDNGKVVSVRAGTPVLLSSGATKLVQELASGDDIASAWLDALRIF